MLLAIHSSHSMSLNELALKALEFHNRPAQALELEFTESCVMEAPANGKLPQVEAALPWGLALRSEQRGNAPHDLKFTQ